MIDAAEQLLVDYSIPLPALSRWTHGQHALAHVGIGCAAHGILLFAGPHVNRAEQTVEMAPAPNPMSLRVDGDDNAGDDEGVEWEPGEEEEEEEDDEEEEDEEEDEEDE